jgi:hypothetical protein
MEAGVAGAEANRREGRADTRRALPTTAELFDGAGGAAGGAAGQFVRPSLSHVGHVVLSILNIRPLPLPPLPPRVPLLSFVTLRCARAFPCDFADHVVVGYANEAQKEALLTGSVTRFVFLFFVSFTAASLMVRSRCRVCMYVCVS